MCEVNLMVNLYERIERLCEERGISSYKLLKDCNLSRGLMSDLKNGRRKTLLPETLKVIANYLRVSVDKLIGNENFEEEENFDYKAAFFGGYDGLNEEEISALWQDVQDFARFRKGQLLERKKIE